MKKVFLTLLTALTMNAAWAGPREDAVTAYDRKDYETALKIAKPFATKGEAWAQNMLGLAYDKGDLVTQDYEEAIML